MRKLIFLILLWLPLVPAWGQSFKNKKQVVSSGGRTAGSSSFNSSTTAGQPVVGQISSATFKILAGFQNTVISVVVPNNAPTNIYISQNSIDENLPDSSVVATLSTEDIDLYDVHTYSLISGGADNNHFFISGDKLKSKEVFNYEAKSTYSLKIQTNDNNGGILSKSFIIYINNMNEPPSLLTLNDSTINEDLPAGTEIGTLTAQDPDEGEAFTYSLVSGAGAEDNASFSIAGNKLKSTEVFHNYIKNIFYILVKVEDAAGDSLLRPISITINKVNIPPTNLFLADSVIVENLPTATFIGLVSATDADPEDSIRYSLVTGTGSTDNSSFTVKNDSLYSAASFNYEVKNIYSLRLEANDNNGGLVSKAFIILITDMNEPPALLTLSDSTIDEDLPAGTDIGTFASQDPDAGDSFTFSLVPGTGGEDNISFSITTNKLKSAKLFRNYQKSLYHILVMVQDVAGDSLLRSFSIYINKVNFAPTALTLSDSTVFENSPAGTFLGIVAATDADPEDKLIYSLVNGTGSDDNSLFTLINDSLFAEVSFNYEVKNTFSIRLEANDNNGGIISRVASILVKDENDNPETLSLSDTVIAELLPSNTVIGTFSASDEDVADALTYSLVTGSGCTDNLFFNISGKDLRSNQEYKQIEKSFYNVRVRVDDGHGGTFERAFTIWIESVNYPPSGISLDDSLVTENFSAGTKVGLLSATDPNTEDNINFSLVAGAGSSDNSSFTISGDTLRTAGIFNYEVKNQYSIRIAASDGKPGGTIERQFTILVSDVNEAPENITISSDSILENSLSVSVVGNFSTADEDTGENFNYSFKPGVNDNTFFTISGNSLKTTEAFNYEVKNNYLVEVNSVDNADHMISKSFIIRVININEAPVLIQLDNLRIDENAPISTQVGILNSLDEDEGDTPTYSFVAGSGDTDNSSFTIAGNVIKSSATFNFEARNQYHVRIKVTDSWGAFHEQEFTITINDLNDTPVNPALSSIEVDENLAAGALVGILSAEDEDTGTHLTFTLVPGFGDNSSFTITDSLLKTAAVFNYEAKASYSVKVNFTDGSGGILTATFTIHIIDADEIPPEITGSEYPQFYDKGSGNKTLRITATDNKAITSVYIFHKGIGEKTEQQVTLSLNSAPNYSFQFNESMLDNMGMDFRFEVYDALGNKSMDSGAVYLRFPSTVSPTIPNLIFGGTKETYQIIAIPYELEKKGVTDIFNELGTYDKKKWRLLTYNNSNNTYREFDDFITIDQGTGYWFNAVNEVLKIDIGAGNAVQNNHDNPFVINLKGNAWNQIGNPYPFAISWADVKAANGNRDDFKGLKTCLNGITFIDITELPAFRGAFVFATSDAIINIPPINTVSSGGKNSEKENKLRNPLDVDNWQVSFDLESSGYKYNLGGFGMNKEANEWIDSQDDFTAPRLFDYLELNFVKKQGEYPKFTRDIVPASENKIWEFNAETNLPGAESILSWDNSYFGDNGKMIILYDPDNQVRLDMRKTSQYIFRGDRRKNFRVYFGGQEFMDKELYPDRSLLAMPYPNPFDKLVNIPFTITRDLLGSHVEISIYNLAGNKIRNLANQTYDAGFHNVFWDGQNFSGEKSSPGMYICIMSLSGKEKRYTYSRKIIIQ